MHGLRGAKVSQRREFRDITRSVNFSAVTNRWDKRKLSDLHAESAQIDWDTNKENPL